MNEAVLDVAVVCHAAREIPEFAAPAEASKYEARLRGYAELLIVAAEVVHAELPRRSAGWDSAGRAINWTRAVLDHPAPEPVLADGGADAVAWQVEDLASGCRLLLRVVDPTVCAWCAESRTELLPVRAIETCSRPGTTLHACAPCRRHHNLRPDPPLGTDQPELKNQEHTP